MIVARPSEGKTVLTLAQARAMSRAIQAGLVPDSEHKVVVYASVEMITEDVETIINADDNWNATQLIRGEAPTDVIQHRAIKRPQLPLWMIGRSRRFFGQKQPDLNAENILASLKIMQKDYGKIPHVLFVDYLQYLPSIEKGYSGSRTEVTESVVREMKELSMIAGIPVILTAQARRETEDSKDKLPGLRSIQHTSFAEQTADRVYSIHRPIRARKDEDEQFFYLNGESYNLDMNLMLVRHLKGRLEQAGSTYAIHLNPTTLECKKATTIDMNGPEAYHQQSPNGLPVTQDALFGNLPPIEL